jgi:hypothetical protein
MGETPDYVMQKRQPPDDIMHDVERARARLAQNLNQLEYRVRNEFDWRVQFDRHPWIFVGAGFAAAFLFGLAITPRRSATAPPAAR